jgi:hypothetical protein
MALPRRTERFGLVLSEQERLGLRYLAEVEGLAEADVLRRLLRVALNDLPPESKRTIGWPPMGAAVPNGSSHS